MQHFTVSFMIMHFLSWDFISPQIHRLRWHSMKSRIFFQESSWAAAWGAVWPPHRVITAGERKTGSSYYSWPQGWKRITCSSGTGLTFFWFDTPQGHSCIWCVRRLNQVASPRVRQTGEELGFTCSTQGLLNLMTNKTSITAQWGTYRSILVKVTANRFKNPCFTAQMLKNHVREHFSILLIKHNFYKLGRTKQNKENKQ